MDDKIEIQKSNYDWLLNSINSADTKAGYLIALDLAIMGYLFSRIAGIAEKTGELSCVIIVILVTLIFIAISLFFAIKAIWPRLSSKEHSIFYFNSIILNDRNAYSKTIMETPNTELLKDLSGQVWKISGILSAKYINIRFSVVFLIIGVFSTIILYVGEALHVI